MAGEAYPTPGSTVSYTQPQYYSDTASQVAGGVQDLLGTNGYLTNVQNNWYGSGQNQAPGQGALGQYSTYDPSKQQQFMNPYVTDVVNSNNQLSNQNLQENILPAVNSTFTGLGQFGSSRNADFANRAIRDNQQTLNNTNANTLYNAENQAATQYGNWQNMGNTQSQQDYTNWMQQANYPVSALTQVGQVLGNMKPTQAAGVSVEGPATTNIDKLASVLGVVNTGLNDNTISSLLDWIGASGALTGGSSTPTV